MADWRVAIAGLAVFAALAMPVKLGAQQVVLPTPSATPTRAPTPVPTPRPFTCSCSSPGRPVIWAGQIAAANPFLASLAASTQCASFLNSLPTSPYMPPPVAQLAPGPPVLVTPTPNPCPRCVCN